MAKDRVCVFSNLLAAAADPKPVAAEGGPARGATVRAICFDTESLCSMKWRRQKTKIIPDCRGRVSKGFATSRNYENRHADTLPVVEKTRQSLIVRSKGGRGLHVADLRPPSIYWPGPCRSGLNRSDPGSVRDPRSQIGRWEARTPSEAYLSAWIYEEVFPWRLVEGPNYVSTQGSHRAEWRIGARARNTWRNGRGGLHVADSFSLPTHGPKFRSSGLDIREPVLIRVRLDPRQQIQVTNHRSGMFYADLTMHKEKRTKTEPDLEMCLQPEQVTNPCFQILIKPS